jgi:hypothetical protein
MPVRLRTAFGGKARYCFTCPPFWATTPLRPVVYAGLFFWCGSAGEISGSSLSYVKYLGARKRSFVPIRRTALRVCVAGRPAYGPTDITVSSRMREALDESGKHDLRFLFRSIIERFLPDPPVVGAASFKYELFHCCPEFNVGGGPARRIAVTRNAGDVFQRRYRC